MAEITMDQARNLKNCGLKPEKYRTATRQIGQQAENLMPYSITVDFKNETS